MERRIWPSKEVHVLISLIYNNVSLNDKREFRLQMELGLLIS